MDSLVLNPHLTCKPSLLRNPRRAIHSPSLVHFPKKDASASQLKVWRDGVKTSSESPSELRRFLQDYEGWQGAKPPKKPRSRTKNKAKNHTPKILSILQALEEIPDVDEALSPWKDALSENEQGMLLDAQWRCDRALALFAWLNTQPSYTPNTCHYTIMLKKCGRAQKWRLVRELLSEMEARGVKMNSYSYNTLIDVNEKAGRRAEATAWFERSKRAGFVDEVGVGSEICVLKEEGAFEEGNRLFEALPGILAEKKKSRVSSDKEAGSGSNGNNGNQAASASTSQSSAPSDPPMKPKKADTYNIMMDLHGKSGDFHRASATFRDMLQAGVAPDIVTYNTMIHICGRSGRVREAKTLFNKITEKGLTPDVATYNTMISMFLRRGEKHRALGYYQKMKLAGVSPDAFTFQILLRHSVVDVGNGAEVGKHITSLMEELAAGVGERVEESELVQTIMLNLYKYAGMKEEAIAAAKRMREQHLPTTLLSFNSVLEMSQSLSEAQATLTAMDHLHILPDVSTYNRMAGLLKRVGLYHEALQQIQDADSAGIPFNLHILTTAASLYSHVGLHEEAVEACFALRKCGFPLDAPAYNAMVYAFGNAGRVDEAVRISMEMRERDVEADVVTYTSVISVYAKMGLVEGVSRVYKRMKKAQCEPDEVTYKELISVYKEAGREDLAAMVFQERQFARYLAKQYKEVAGSETVPEEEEAVSDGSNKEAPVVADSEADVEEGKAESDGNDFAI